MTAFDNIPVVEIDQEGGHKFILVQIGEGENRKCVIWARENCGYHREILAHFARHYGVRASCRGGGQIQVSPEKKHIEVWGSSGDFGWPDYELVIQMLEQAFEGWTIKNPRG